MIKTALIGNSISHSLSGVIHNAAYKSVGLEGKYDIIDIKPERLLQTIQNLKDEGYAGFNVTIPYKVEVRKQLQLWDMFVDYAGCTNCVKIKPDGALYGYNTDIYGFTEAIEQNKRDNLAEKKALIIGNGGAARAVAVALVMMKISKIDFLVRDIQKAFALKELLKINFKDTACETIQKVTDIKSYSMIINATPLGTVGENETKMPIAASLLEKADKSVIVYDLVYNPQRTVFIKTAQEIGLDTIGGLDMLIYQAQKAFKVFTGKQPDYKCMKEAVQLYI